MITISTAADPLLSNYSYQMMLGYNFDYEIQNVGIIVTKVRSLKCKSFLLSHDRNEIDSCDTSSLFPSGFLLRKSNGLQ